MDMGIAGRWAIVCASSKGLGKGCATALAAEGVNVVINGRSAETVKAAAAGIRIGTAVAFPGDRSRIDAAAETGRSAATAMVGVVVMLLVAGILEGVGRQSINITGARYAIGGLMLLGWCSYFYLLRARSRFDHG